LLTAAGGAMRTPQGGALVYGQDRENFLVPGFIATGDPAAAMTPPV
jgi:3'(2'), 5'-bisphosphate nucleotidase